jgi:phosphoribosyl 1,2-cyclic phosphate phosphodiesterase
MSRMLRVTILGSGCSTGVPRVDGYWGACDPQNPKNRRSRCSAWVSAYNDGQPEKLTSVVIDTSPDLRHQVIAAGIPKVDAVLWTHDHADQTHGIDDLRAFIFHRDAPIDGYMDEATHETLISRFNYVFRGNQGYPPVYIDHIIPAHGTRWDIAGEGGNIPILTFDQIHGPIRSVGYRLGDIAYSSDVSDIPEESFEALSGLKLWIVDALRHKPHPTHSHLEKTLEWIARVKPDHAVLTNLHQDLDYDALKSILPKNVEPAFDQLTVAIEL